MRVEILDAQVPEQRTRWLELWSRWSGREVQAHPAYLELFAAAGERVQAAALDAGETLVLYPFIVRPIPQTDAFDLTSPYGYGGAYGVGPELDTLTTSVFWPAVDEWARGAGIVSEVIRLAVGTVDRAPYPGERIERLRNVIVPTSVAPDVLWTRYAHKVRKNVQKARRGGVTIETDPTGEHLGEFLRIYAGTMVRREAAEAYRFSASFFETLGRTLPGQYMYFHARAAGQIISTELALVSADRIYSFLGGTDEHAFDLRPNDLLKHEMIVWAHTHGKREFVLGGGYGADDGIYKYKESFAPDGSVPFFTGQRIFDQARYDALVAHRTEQARASGSEIVSGFFPGYRAPLRAIA